jgi:hypothetical protein
MTAFTSIAQRSRRFDDLTRTDPPRDRVESPNGAHRTVRIETIAAGGPQAARIGNAPHCASSYVAPAFSDSSISVLRICTAGRRFVERRQDPVSRLPNRLVSARLFTFHFTKGLDEDLAAGGGATSLKAASGASAGDSVADRSIAALNAHRAL